MTPIVLTPTDALLIVDVQNDFLPGGSLAVPYGDEIIPVLNRYIATFAARSLPVYATRDWHTQDHCSFKERGGPWPPHCIAHSHGAEFAPTLQLPGNAVVVSKAMSADADAYSGFEHTDLKQLLHASHSERLFIGGLATDYCVLNTVIDALSLGFEVKLLVDAIRAVNRYPKDGQTAIDEMIDQGAEPIRLQDIDARGPYMTRASSTSTGNSFRA